MMTVLMIKKKLRLFLFKYFIKFYLIKEFCTSKNHLNFFSLLIMILFIFNINNLDISEKK